MNSLSLHFFIIVNVADFLAIKYANPRIMSAPQRHIMRFANHSYCQSVLAAIIELPDGQIKGFTHWLPTLSDLNTFPDLTEETIEKLPHFKLEDLKGIEYQTDTDVYTFDQKYKEENPYVFLCAYCERAFTRGDSLHKHVRGIPDKTKSSRYIPLKSICRERIIFDKLGRYDGKKLPKKDPWAIIGIINPAYNLKDPIPREIVHGFRKYCCRNKVRL